jgi:hypothetical protein
MIPSPVSCKEKGAARGGRQLNVSSHLFPQCELGVPRCVNTIGVGEGEGTWHPQGPHYVTRCARTYLLVAMHLHSSIASANASDVVKNNNARLIQPFLLAHCTILQQVYSLLSRLSDSFAHYAIMHRTLA